VHRLAGQPARFAVVGLANTALSLAVLDTLTSLGLPAGASGAAAFAAGAVNRYAWNRRWTFAAPDTPRARTAYLCVQALGLGATSLLLWALERGAGLGELAGYALTLPPVTAATFLANRAWTFSSAGTTAARARPRAGATR
jgi:putative flippase GtrA